MLIPSRLSCTHFSPHHRACMFMAMPTDVVHDLSNMHEPSPLMPPEMLQRKRQQAEAAEAEAKAVAEAAAEARIKRAVEKAVTMRGLEREHKHEPVHKQAESEKQAVRSPDSHDTEMSEIAAYWRDADMQIVVLLEGIEPLSSDTIQARYWYAAAADVAWNRDFRPCVYKAGDVADKPGAVELVVDCEHFHELTGGGGAGQA